MPTVQAQKKQKKAGGGGGDAAAHPPVDPPAKKQGERRFQASSSQPLAVQCGAGACHWAAGSRGDVPAGASHAGSPLRRLLLRQLARRTTCAAAPVQLSLSAHAVLHDAWLLTQLQLQVINCAFDHACWGAWLAHAAPHVARCMMRCMPTHARLRC